MTPLSDLSTAPPLPRFKVEEPLKLSIGAASPLWMMFAGAAATGAAYWWMTRWMRPVNLEAMLGETAIAALPEPEPGPAAAPDVVETVAIEAAPSLSPAAEPAEPPLGPVIDPAPRPAAKQVSETVAKPVAEAAAPKAPAPAAAKPKPARTPLPPEA